MLLEGSIPAQSNAPISEQEARIIDGIRTRLHDTVSTYRIINWLNNYPREDWPNALKVLESLNYYPLSEIIAAYDHGLQNILQLAGNDELIFVHGYGKLGKSGSTMLYFFKQSPVFKANESRFVILNHVAKLRTQGLRNGSILILLDDIIGSGQSLLKFYRHNIGIQLLREEYRLNSIGLCVAFMEEAENLFKKELPDMWLMGTPYYKAFRNRGSVFGYPPKMLPVREWCYKWGKSLFSLLNREKKTMVIHALGYANSQALIVFEHSVPNNTLPIIWSVKNGWYPLYPRSAQGKMSEVKDFRTDNFYWLNMAYKMKVIQRAPRTPWTQKLDFELIALMRLKQDKASPQKIFQYLGITVRDYDEIVLQGRDNGWFDNEDQLTEEGIDKYQEIKQQISIENTRINRKSYTFNSTVLYIPKQFGKMT